MSTLKTPAGKPKPAPTPSEAELAVYRLLVAARPTREERRMTVRLLLRRASRTLERSK